MKHDTPCSIHVQLIDRMKKHVKSSIEIFRYFGNFFFATIAILDVYSSDRLLFYYRVDLVKEKTM